jgi:hypothetical protein
MLKATNSVINASQIATPVTLSGNVTLSTGNLAIGTSGKGVTTGSAIPLGLGTNNGTAAVTLDTSGRFLIGSTSSFSAAAKLQVQDNIGFETNGSGGKFEFFRYGVQTGSFDTPATSGQLNISAVSVLSFRTAVTERINIGANGNVGIGAAANASAILDAQSTTKGVRMPNMTTTQKDAIASPAAGLMVFDTTLAKLCVYSGVAWQTITSV